MSPRRILLTIAFAVIAFTAGGQTLLFNNIGEPLPKKDSTLIIRVLKHQLDFYNNYCTLDTLRVDLRIFTSQVKMAQYLLANEYSYSGGFPAGVYFEKTKEACVLKTEDNDYKAIAYHEICHHLSHLAVRNLPLWLNEGLSRYFEKITVGKKGVKSVLPEFSIGQIRSAYYLDEVDLKKAIAWDYTTFYKDSFTNQGFPYTISHAMVYFLIEQKRAVFDQIIRLIQHGDSSDYAFDHAYDGGLEQFEQDFQAFVFL